MMNHLRAILWLLVLTLVFCSIIYPAALLGIGKVLFAERAEGSLILGADGKPLGSRLIAQPFAGEEYLQPRPSAASYNGAASAATNWGPSNYLLRERVARQLGPIVKYATGPKKGQLAASDIEAWFQQDRLAGKPGIVAQWAQVHSTIATSWVKADSLNAAYVASWQKDHPAEVADWIKQNPGTPEPKPEDLAVPFFVNYSAAHPGTFPGIAERQANGKAERHIEPAKSGTDIQGIFFDLWRQEHPDEDLHKVPADLVMASGSGLDPHVTLKNALYQLDRMAAKWAEKTKQDSQQIRKEIETLLLENTTAPLGGLVGDNLVNVLEINLALKAKFGS